MQARAEQADRLEVERAVTGDGGLQNADDFWLAVQLDDLRDADGALDAAKFKAARDRVIADRPALAQARSELRRWRSGDASGYVRAELWAGTEADGDGRLHQPFSLACPDLRCRLR